MAEIVNLFSAFAAGVAFISGLQLALTEHYKLAILAFGLMTLNVALILT